MAKDEKEKSVTGELIDLVKEKLNDLLNIVKVKETDSLQTRMGKRILSLPVALFIVLFSPLVLLTLIIALAIAL